MTCESAKKKQLVTLYDRKLGKSVVALLSDSFVQKVAEAAKLLKKRAALWARYDKHKTMRKRKAVLK